MPNAVKTGMIPNADLIQVTADVLKQRGVKNLVIDPVMVSTSGSSLMANAAVETLKTQLLPLKGLVTPNIPEAHVLTGFMIRSEKEIEQAAQYLYEKYGSAVLIKGGHGIQDANDFLYSEHVQRWFRSERIDNPNTHGTGCTLSSAIASYLAKGCTLEQAVECGKAYLTGAIRANLDLGKGSGPLNHMYALN